MRPLLTVTAVAGLLLGGAAAVAWHYASLVHGGAWFAYAPAAGEAQVSWQGTGWLPALVVGPAAGLLLGLGAGWVLLRTGWRLRRMQA